VPVEGALGRPGDDGAVGQFARDAQHDGVEGGEQDGGRGRAGRPDVRVDEVLDLVTGVAW
jgi:hypothetical protein